MSQECQPRLLHLCPEHFQMSPTGALFRLQARSAPDISMFQPFQSNLTFTAAVLPLSNPTDTVIDVLHEAISDPWRTTNKVCWTVLVLSELGPLASGPSCYPFLKEDGTVVMAPSKPIHTKASVNFYWWDRYLALLEPASVFEPWAGIWG